MDGESELWGRLVWVVEELERVGFGSKVRLGTEMRIVWEEEAFVGEKRTMQKDGRQDELHEDRRETRELSGQK